MYELPANHRPIALVGDFRQLAQAKQFLQLKGYQVVEVFLSDDAFWEQASKLALVQRGDHSIQLWQANPLLTEIIDLLEAKVSGRSALDLACGAGRDSVYLAQRGWDVTAIDHKMDAIERCNRLAKSAQVEINALIRDLENQPQPLADLNADLVLVMRYLHRPLFPAIDSLIQSGGGIVYSTFMEGSEQFGSPRNPAYLLKPGELAEQFSGYEILLDEQRQLADGRPVSLFVAFKP